MRSSQSHPPAHDVDDVPDVRAGFLAAAPVDEHVHRMFDTDLTQQGYIANLTRLWAHSPESLAALSYVLKRAADAAELDPRERAVVVTASAATLGDSYCSLAFGSKVASAAGVAAAVGMVSGRDDDVLTTRERALAGWARRVVGDPNATGPADVDVLRAAGLDDGQVFAVTVFVALRLAFSTVNDALGASPDEELAARTPDALLAAVDYGRAPGGAPA
jgi:alkylhydroperoxidase family enzyme